MALANVGGKDLEGQRRTSKDVLSSRIEPEGSPQMFDCLLLLFTKGAQWVDEIGVGL